MLRSRRRSNPDSAPMSPTAKVMIGVGGALGVGAIVLLARRASAAAAVTNPGAPALPMIVGSDDESLTQPTPPPGGISFGVNTSAGDPTNVAGAANAYRRVGLMVREGQGRGLGVSPVAQ